jgi:hypothetical protein
MLQSPSSSRLAAPVSSLNDMQESSVSVLRLVMQKTLRSFSRQCLQLKSQDDKSRRKQIGTAASHVFVFSVRRRQGVDRHRLLLERVTKAIANVAIV